MGAIAEIFRRYGDGYLAENAGLPATHRKVIRAIQRCRTAESGSFVLGCCDCQRPVTVFCSCGNRHCPT